MMARLHSQAFLRILQITPDLKNMTIPLTSVHKKLIVGAEGVLELGAGTRILGTDEQTCNLIIIAYQLETIP